MARRPTLPRELNARQELADRVTEVLDTYLCRGSHLVQYVMDTKPQRICDVHDWGWPEGQQYCNAISQDAVDPKDTLDTAPALHLLKDLREAGVI